MSTSRAVAFAIFAFTALSAFAVDPPPQNERWTKTTADEITIYSNARDGAVKNAVQDLLRMRAVLASVGKLNVHSALPTTAIVFKSETSYAQYRDLVLQREQKAKEVRGIFFTARRGNIILINAASDGIDNGLYHEMTHSVVRNNAYGLPLWFDEGLAEFYGNIKTTGDVVKVGVIDKFAIEYLLRTGLMPLHRFLAVGHKSPEYIDADKNAQYYIQAWMMVHYMMIGNPERGARADALLQAMERGLPIEQAFQSSFGVTIDQFEGELNHYINQPRFNYVEYKLADLHPREFAAPVEVSRDETLTALGEVLIAADQVDEAKKLLQAAVAANSKNANAHADLGLVAEHGGRTAEADDEYKLAIASATSQARPFELYGESLIVRLQQMARDGAAVSKVQIGQVRALAEKSVALDPSSPRALGVLGATYTLRGEDAAKGIALDEKALALAPDQIDIAVDLVLLYDRAGKFGLAKNVIDKYVATMGSEKDFATANESPFLVEYEHALDAMDAGRKDAAIALFDAVVTHTTNKQLKFAAEKKLETLQQMK